MMTRTRKDARNVSFSKRNDVKMCDSAALASGNGYYLPPVGKSLKASPSLATLSRLERQNIVVWKQPLKTLNYSVRELCLVVYENLCKLLRNKLLLISLCTLFTLLYCLYVIPGPHTPLFVYLERKSAWCIYWIVLGILSSVGLGTGLHTFLLYLGPHIASVTLAAYECQSLRFPEPPYPEQIVCPGEGLKVNGNSAGNFTPIISNASAASSGPETAGEDILEATISTLAASSMISLWAIMSKVRVEAFMWGAGTALGELPPYFMAKAARMSGDEPDDEEYREFMSFMRQKEEEERSVLQTSGSGHLFKHDLWASVKLGMQKLIESVGFFGILLCASIPNPLFDLAGITCGHFLVPFWTFFGATLLGKAVIKMHIQKLFVILAFSEHHVEKCVSALKHIPKIGPSLQSPFKELLIQQKMKLHRRVPGSAFNASSTAEPLAPVKTSLLQKTYELIFLGMVLYFVVSLINSLAQNYDKRLYQQQKKKRQQTKSH